MPAGPGRRKRTSGSFSILVVPEREGGKTRTFRLRPWMMAAGVLGAAVLVAGVTLLLVVFTPAGRYLPIPNPDLERRYGRRITETQEQLHQLAEDVLVLKDYNRQLRRALGERTADSASTASRAERGTPDTVIAGAGIPRPPLAVRAVVPEGDAGLMDDRADGSPVLGAAGLRAEFPLIAPTDGYVSSRFDAARSHFGMDFATRTGSPVHAAADGYVVFAGWTYEDGNMLMLSHGDGTLTVYKHAQTLLKAAHTFVRRGDLIATVGTTGTRSGGPHLHFELWRGGLPQDPAAFLLNVPGTD